MHANILKKFTRKYFSQKQFNKNCYNLKQICQYLVRQTKFGCLFGGGKGRSSMKKAVISLFTAFFVAVSMVCTLQKTETSLAEGVIRLHVRANSDSNEDQTLKLKVRDRIIAECSDIFSGEDDIVCARNAVINNIEKIRSIAQSEVESQGYDYPVRVKFGKSDFPDKVYANITMPAGTYEALIVEIGSGKGQNWWCVLFPPLCFVDETCTGMSKKSENILIDNLGKETYEMIKSDKKPPVKLRFKIYEVWENNKKKIQTLFKNRQ